MVMAIRLVETPKFSLGRVVMTQGAFAALEDHPEKATAMLARHSSGDWGNVCDDDKRENDRALCAGDRLISAYPIDETMPCGGHGDNCMWLISEWDRSVTTFLLPSEY